MPGEDKIEEEIKGELGGEPYEEVPDSDIEDVSNEISNEVARIAEEEGIDISKIGKVKGQGKSGSAKVDIDLKKFLKKVAINSFLEKVKELLVERKDQNLSKRPTNMPVWLGISMPRNMPQPKGTFLSEPQPNLLIVAFDESLSVSNELLGLFKSMVGAICEENKDIAVLALSMTEGPETAIAEVVTRDNLEGLMKRNLAGGTADFIKALTQFDKVLEKRGKELADKLSRAKGTNMTSENLRKLYEDGKIALVVFTDGYTSESLSSEELEKFEQIKSNREGKPPVLYVVPEGNKSRVGFYPSSIKKDVDFWEIPSKWLKELGIEVI